MISSVQTRNSHSTFAFAFKTVLLPALLQLQPSFHSWLNPMAETMFTTLLGVVDKQFLIEPPDDVTKIWIPNISTKAIIIAKGLTSRLPKITKPTSYQLMIISHTSGTIFRRGTLEPQVFSWQLSLSCTKRGSSEKNILDITEY